MKWFTSDQHFFHANVISYCGRHYLTVEEMNACLIKRYNDCVSVDDVSYFLGDFAFGGVAKRKEILGQLNGIKILVRGNHDGDFKDCEKVGFAAVVDEAVIKLGHKTVRLSHFPYHGWNVDERHPGKHPGPGMRLDEYLLHGHVHQHWKVRGPMINVGVDAWNYSPVSEKVLHQIWQMRENYLKTLSGDMKSESWEKEPNYEIHT